MNQQHPAHSPQSASLSEPFDQTETAREETASKEITGKYKTCIRECLGAEDRPASLRPLARQMRRVLQVLRRGYRQAIRQGNSSTDEWLADNYYLLLREGQGTAAGLYRAEKQPGLNGEPALYRLFRDLLPLKGVPDRQAMDALLEEAGKVRPLTVMELEQLPLCLKAALLTLAARGVADGGDEGERLLELAVTGLRQVGELDFVSLTQHHSIVERILTEDPAGLYPRLEEETRTAYRQAVAWKAKRLGKSEAAVAADAVEQANQAREKRHQHVGAWLLNEDRPRRRFRGRVTLVCTALLPLLAAVPLAVWTGSPWAYLLLVLPVWELLRPFIEEIARRTLPPRRLPRIDLEGRVPEEGRTVIAVATLLPPADRAEEVGQHLLRLYETNGVGAVQICLLADLSQAPYPVMPADETDIAAMVRTVRRLNDRYGSHFFLAVRPRVYSQTMRAYSGWERKRGALTQLARWIRGEEESFHTLEGDQEQLRHSRYLLALDSDTVLRLDTLPLLVGTALHPQNQPVVDDIRGRVTAGYGVLTPRMGVTLESAGKTSFSRVMAGIGGVTAYDSLASDIYMDGFEESIFAGKGLIDIAAFVTVTDGIFPPEQVLSHDILEGCLLRTGLVSDVEMIDGVPSHMGGWLDRLHRWIRGDWQNLPFLWHPGLSFTRLDKWKLLDNLRRSLTPAAILLALLLSPLFPHGTVLTVVGLLAAVSGQLLAAGLSLLYGGWQTLVGKYYSRVMPRAMSALAQAAMTLVMLPATAYVGVTGALTALIRLKTRRNLLEWVTAADSERRKSGWTAAIRRFWYTLPIAGLAVWCGGLLRVCGLLFLALIPVAVWTAKKARKKTLELSGEERQTLRGYAAAAWQYYAQTCTPAEHDLPPDNLQESPVWRVAHRTSPTNMGMYLLSVLAARDLGLIEPEEMLARIDRSLTTMERLETWKGHLLNWYDTRSLRPLSPRYVSTVDSGNLACCLAALRQGLLEGADQKARELADRAGRLAAGMDFTPLYNKRRALFYIGLDPDTGACSPSYYDLLMSESRLTGYYAIATRQVAKRHWGALGRMLARSGGYVGPVSWTGTMFEYFLPRIFLPAPEGSMSYEALRFCLRCQKRRVPHGIPWGISESGFYAFDSNLNYQYKAHGVPRLALKRGMAADLVIAPYASFLTLTTDPHGALRNLQRLEAWGMTGGCGFYEAADFTRGRAPVGGCSMVRSYMAHHVGMSLLACTNALCEDVFVRRFLREPDMARARELLLEQPPANGAVYEMVQEPAVAHPAGRETVTTREIVAPNPRAPQMQLLSSGEWLLAISDSGSGISVYRGLDIHMASADLLRRPQGIFFVVDGGEGAFSPTRAPLDDGLPEQRATFGEGYAAFTAQKGALSAGLRVMVHPRLPGEQRQLVVQNTGSGPLTVRILVYGEPCLARREDAAAHPAFSRLFLTQRWDQASGALVITRRPRGEEPPLCLAVGFLENVPVEHEPSREAVLTSPEGIASLAQALDKPFSSEGDGVPDGCLALRTVVNLPPRGGKATLTLALTAAPAAEEAISRFLAMRREAEAGSRLTPARAAKSPFGGVEAQLAQQILPDLFYPPRMSREWAAAARNNTRGQESLWALGISGDFPLLLMEIHNAADAPRTEPYMRLHRSLRLGGVTTDLAILYREGGDYDAPVLEAIRQTAVAAGCQPFWGERGGIHPVNLLRVDEETAAYLTAVCVHNGARDLLPIGLPMADYKPMSIQNVEKRETIQIKEALSSENDAMLPIPGMYFYRGEGHICRTEEEQKLPWCYPLANPTFGTLVSDQALGFTWAINSRENKLTPWFNDTASDNRGELLLLRAGGQIYDTVWGSTAIFGEGFARYEGQAGSVETTVTVAVPSRGMYKRVTLTMENTGEEELDVQAAYYTEPMLGVDRRWARHTVARWETGTLRLRNPFSPLGGELLLTAEGGADSCDCDRGSFLSGNWGAGTLAPVPDPCGAVVVRKKLPPRRKETITFVLGYTRHERGAAVLGQSEDIGKPVLAGNWPRLTCPDEELADMMTHWLPRQIVNSRLYGRTGFYQCGGAWGFRDQLQDCLATLWGRPELLARQLQRCAAVQFPEGDVLHWWHRLPGKPIRGVRTRCSDDLVWLPYGLTEYLDFTGDAALLDTPVGWITGPLLEPNEQERYLEVGSTAERSSLYEHAVRALDHAITHGAHYLPLIGSGDWNDGFNRVGDQGKGESVWLALFLAMTLDRFAPLCRQRQDTDRADRYTAVAEGYRHAVEAVFVEDRYLRAFRDEGVPLGQPGAKTCAVDSLSQSFAVLARLLPEHTTPALDTAVRELVREDAGLVRLFAPSFEQPDETVGYTASYPAGIRENGGQYTHAAMWLVIALLETDRVEEAVRLLRILNPLAGYADGRGPRYQGEPYALAGDVYDHPGCVGRAGWTLYTGAAGWMYTAVLRHLAGVQPHGEILELHPRLPREWPELQLEWTIRSTPLQLTIRRLTLEEAGQEGLWVNGKPAAHIRLDGRKKQVEFRLSALS